MKKKNLTTRWRSDLGVWSAQVAAVIQAMPETQEADIHCDEDVANVRNLSADIMNELRRVRKWVPSRISLVKMSLGLMSPGMWRRSISLSWMLSRTAQSRRLM